MNDNATNNYNNLATCSYCQRTFDTCKEGFINPENSQRICSSCYRKNYETTGVVKKTGNAVLTIIGGFFAFLGIFGLIANAGVGFSIFLILLGAAFFVWKYVPIYKKKKEAEKWKSTVKSAAVQLDHWHCNNCGANTCGEYCEYCNSPYEKSV